MAVRTAWAIQAPVLKTRQRKTTNQHILPLPCTALLTFSDSRPLDTALENQLHSKASQDVTTHQCPVTTIFSEF